MLRTGCLVDIGKGCLFIHFFLLLKWPSWTEHHPIAGCLKHTPNDFSLPFSSIPSINHFWHQFFCKHNISIVIVHELFGLSDIMEYSYRVLQRYSESFVYHWLSHHQLLVSPPVPCCQITCWIVSFSCNFCAQVIQFQLICHSCCFTTLTLNKK